MGSDNLKKSLNPKQQRFCDEYLIDCNATRSATAAGYSPKTAYAIGAKLLKKAEIQRYIEERLESLHTQKTADLKEIMEYLTSVMRGESDAEVVVVEGKGDGISKAVKLKKAPEERDKLKAAELLGKRFGLTEPTNISVTVPIVIRDDLDDG